MERKIPEIGDAITYRLRLAEQPVDPLRFWHATVENVHTSPDWYIVRLLDEGYENMRERVLPFQIVEVFKFFSAMNRE